MKIVIGPFTGADKVVEELRAEFPDVAFATASTLEDQRHELVDADALCGTPDRQTFLAARKLGWIHNFGTGIDQMLQIPELIDSEVVITNAPGRHAGAMADHVMAVVLAIAHRLRDMIDDQRAKRWDNRKYSQTVVELDGRVMGLLGIGSIGRAVATRARGFGMRVVAVDPHPFDLPTGVEIWGLERLDELLTLSDWFVVTAPQTDQTRGLIDARRIGLLKHDAGIVVSSRGQIVDEVALAEALRSGHLRGAGVDAFAEEPLSPDSPLWGLENVIISPHASGASPEVPRDRCELLKMNVRRFIEGLPVVFVCDKRRGY